MFTFIKILASNYNIYHSTNSCLTPYLHSSTIPTKQQKFLRGICKCKYGSKMIKRSLFELTTTQCLCGRIKEINKVVFLQPPARTFHVIGLKHKTQTKKCQSVIYMRRNQTIFRHLPKTDLQRSIVQSYKLFHIS